MSPGQYDVYRVACADGRTFEPVYAWMSDQGAVQVRQNGVRVLDLPPSMGCTIARLENAPLPVDAGPPEALAWIGGIFAVFMVVGAAVIAIAASRMQSTLGPFGMMYVPPPVPVPPPPPPPVP